MPEDDKPVPEPPSTWENIVDGEVKEAVGHLLHNKALIDEGKDEAEIAREVREEYREEQPE